MIKYLETYCDINQIPDSQTRIKGWEYITQRPQAPLYIKHRYAPILEAFQKLLNNRRSLEKFMMYGDSNNPDVFLQSKNHSSTYDAITLTLKKDTIRHNSLIMLTEESIQYLQSKQNKKREETVKSLEEKKCLLLPIQRV